MLTSLKLFPKEEKMEYLVGGMSIFDFFQSDDSAEAGRLRNLEARDIAERILSRFPSVKLLQIRGEQGAIFLEVPDEDIIPALEREFACRLISAVDESDLFWRFGEIS